MNNKKLLLYSNLADHFSSPEVIRAILSKSTVISFRKGDVLIGQGERCCQVGLVAKGIAKWYLIESGKESVLQFFGEDDFITGPFSFFQNEPTQGTIEALEDMDVYFITREQFDEIGDLYPSFLTESYQILSQTMMGFYREKNELLRLPAVERYLYFQDRYGKIANRISLGNISAYLGIRQSSLSRVRREISKNGL